MFNLKKLEAVLVKRDGQDNGVGKHTKNATKRAMAYENNPEASRKEFT